MKAVRAISSGELYSALKMLVSCVLGVVPAAAIWNVGFNAITTSGSIFVVGLLKLMVLTIFSIALATVIYHLAYTRFVHWLTWKTVLWLREAKRQHEADSNDWF